MTARHATTGQVCVTALLCWACGEPRIVELEGAPLGTAPHPPVTVADALPPDSTVPPTTTSTTEAGPPPLSTNEPLDLYVNCVETIEPGQPLDMLVLLDQSAAMLSIATSVNSALDSFMRGVNEQDEVNVALTLFGVSCATDETGCAAATMAGPLIVDDATSCDAISYEQPTIDFARMPAEVERISCRLPDLGISSCGGPLLARRPQSAVGPALEGALAYAKQRSLDRPTHKVLVVLATTGVGAVCSPTTTTALAQIARDGYSGVPSIQTYVISPDTPVSGMDDIARAGGGEFFNALSGSTSAFEASMNEIRARALPCSFPVSSAVLSAPDRANVRLVTPDGTKPVQTVPYLEDQGACGVDGHGWYFDDSVSPSKITVCAETCAAFANSSGGNVEVVTGCDRLVR